MKNLPGLAGSLLFAFVSLTSTATAEAPAGAFNYQFNANEGPALWNFSGDYGTPYYLTNDTLRLSHNGRGGLDGDYLAPGQAGGFVVGTIRGTRSNLKLSLLSQMAFPMEHFSEGWMRRRDKLSLQFDPGTMTLSGHDSVEEKYQVVVYHEFPYSTLRTVSRHSFKQPVTMAVPPETDGSWMLELNIIPAGTRLSGTAAIHFAAGPPWQFQLVGSYSPKRDASKLLLKGTGTSTGAILVLSIRNPEMGIERMSGRVGGQSVRFPQK